MLFAVKVIVNGINYNSMNAQIWLKGVTAGLEFESFAELDIPLIGGVRGLCSTIFSKGLRLEEEGT